ncbi:hypothetical protein PR001_g29131 [Phytophthora rubi]|uniref:Uncharacterized protein n=1 Tax=Phytophthora rubi TaxID=129364 RepID=A0A6A3H604_9STRA|nr:hypothetical protein PR001_g29131 [Phytophthora rubi]
MARRHDVDADDIDLEEGELDTNDLEAAGCVVCALGARRLRLPIAPQAQLPASGAPVHSVTALVADAHILQRENQELRTQYELVSAHNAGLATHASVLHDRNLAILHRAREGYRAGMIRLEQLQAAQDQIADYAAQLARASATPPPSAVPLARLFAAQGERDDARAERDDLRVDLAAAQAALKRARTPPKLNVIGCGSFDALAERDRVTRVLVVAEQERDGALGMRDQARRISTALRRERDAAVTERDQARQAVAALEQRRDAAVAERDQARLALTAQRQQRALVDEELRVTRTTTFGAPTPLLVAHAEELRRGATRIHELEESVATATTHRVAAESEMARAQAGALGAASRAAQYRAGWMSVRRSSQQRREAVGAQVYRLSVRVVELEKGRDLAIRERDERAVAWRRMLRDARRGRELAQRVRDELADRLAGVVMGVGGHIDTGGLISRLEATFTAEIDAAPP